LMYLRARFCALGGQIMQRRVEELAEALAECATVVNCSGLGARELVRDNALYPIRGQIVRISGRHGIGRILIDDRDPDAPTYIVPRSTDCVLGGTSEENASSLEPEARIATAILERCANLVPEVRRARVLQHRVGLRPGRRVV